jgi:hypothetical protein
LRDRRRIAARLLPHFAFVYRSGNRCAQNSFPFRIVTQLSRRESMSDLRVSPGGGLSMPQGGMERIRPEPGKGGRGGLAAFHTFEDQTEKASSRSKLVAGVAVAIMVAAAAAYGYEASNMAAPKPVTNAQLPAPEAPPAVATTPPAPPAAATQNNMTPANTAAPAAPPVEAPVVPTAAPAAPPVTHAHITHARSTHVRATHASAAPSSAKPSSSSGVQARMSQQPAAAPLVNRPAPTLVPTTTPTTAPSNQTPMNQAPVNQTPTNQAAPNQAAPAATPSVSPSVAPPAQPAPAQPSTQAQPSTSQAPTQQPDTTPAP